GLTLMTMAHAKTDPKSSTPAATAGHIHSGLRRPDPATAEATASLGSVTTRSIRLAHRGSGRGRLAESSSACAGMGVDFAASGAGSMPAPVLCCVASRCPAWEAPGFDPTNAPVPDLKNGLSA